jgi:hypothetical protein
VNRLRDEVGQGAIHDKGIDLIRRTPGTLSDAELKRRVWAAVASKGAEPRAARAHRWTAVRSFAVAGVVLCICGSAAAMMGHRLGIHWPWQADAPSAPPPAIAPRVAPPAPRQLAPVATPAPTPPAPAPAVVAAPRSHAARALPPHAIELTPAAAATAERTQVLDAMVALRRDHDAARAGRLLDHYLATHPHGVLREEALVLAIEAAAARGDGATARRLAAGYTDAYPNGRFRAFARDTLGASTP